MPGRYWRDTRKRGNARVRVLRRMKLYIYIYSAPVGRELVDCKNHFDRLLTRGSEAGRGCFVFFLLCSLVRAKKIVFRASRTRITLERGLARADRSVAR